MGRFATSAPTESQLTTEGDAEFTRMNMSEPPDKLKPGEYSLARNRRVRDKVAAKRGGTIYPTFANAVEYEEIYGSGNYSNPNKETALLVARKFDGDKYGVVKVREGSTPGYIAIPDGVIFGQSATGKIEFSQQFHQAFLHGATKEGERVTLTWDGLDTDGFVIAAKSNPDNEIVSVIPAEADWSINIADRAVVPISRDSLAASDPKDYVTFDLTLTGPTFRANSGSADKIVGAYNYANSSILIGKENSFDVIINFKGDLGQTAVQDLAKIGIWARKTGKMVGADFIFLAGPQGVYRISQVIQDRLQADPTPIGVIEGGTDPIGPLLKRVNWGAAHNAVAEALDYYFLALPIDGSQHNNCMVVGNPANDNWEAFDTWPADISFDELHVIPYQGGKRLCAVDHVHKAIYVLYEGKTDYLRDAQGNVARYEFGDEFFSRGYATLGWNATTSRDNKRLEIAFATNDAEITVNALNEKANDVRPLTLHPVTKDRTKYDKWGKPDFVPDNSNGDYHEPGRQDYSPIDGMYWDTPDGEGINVEELQQGKPFSCALKARGRYQQFQIVNSKGDCQILGILAQSSGAQREQRKAAA